MRVSVSLTSVLLDCQKRQDWRTALMIVHRIMKPSSSSTSRSPSTGSQSTVGSRSSSGSCGSTSGMPALAPEASFVAAATMPTNFLVRSVVELSLSGSSPSKAVAGRKGGVFYLKPLDCLTPAFGRGNWAEALLVMESIASHDSLLQLFRGELSRQKQSGRDNLKVPLFRIFQEIRRAAMTAPPTTASGSTPTSQHGSQGDATLQLGEEAQQRALGTLARFSLLSYPGVQDRSFDTEALPSVLKQAQRCGDKTMQYQLASALLRRSVTPAPAVPPTDDVESSSSSTQPPVMAGITSATLSGNILRRKADALLREAIVASPSWWTALVECSVVQAEYQQWKARCILQAGEGEAKRGGGTSKEEKDHHAETTTTLPSSSPSSAASGMVVGSSIVSPSILVALLRLCAAAGMHTAPTGCSPSGERTTEAVTTGAKSWVGALHLFNHLGVNCPRSPAVHTALMFALRRSGRWEECLYLVGTLLAQCSPNNRNDLTFFRPMKPSELSGETPFDARSSAHHQGGGTGTTTEPSSQLLSSRGVDGGGTEPEAGITLECLRATAEGTTSSWVYGLQVLSSLQRVGLDPTSRMYYIAVGAVPHPQTQLNVALILCAGVAKKKRLHRALFSGLATAFSRRERKLYGTNTNWVVGLELLRCARRLDPKESALHPTTTLEALLRRLSPQGDEQGFATDIAQRVKYGGVPLTNSFTQTFVPFLGPHPTGTMYHAVRDLVVSPLMAPKVANALLVSLADKNQWKAAVHLFLHRQRYEQCMQQPELEAVESTLDPSHTDSSSPSPTSTFATEQTAASILRAVMRGAGFDALLKVVASTLPPLDRCPAECPFPRPTLTRAVEVALREGGDAIVLRTSSEKTASAATAMDPFHAVLHYLVATSTDPVVRKSGPALGRAESAVLLALEGTPGAWETAMDLMAAVPQAKPSADVKPTQRGVGRNCNTVLELLLLSVALSSSLLSTASTTSAEVQAPERHLLALVGCGAFSDPLSRAPDVFFTQMLSVVLRSYAASDPAPLHFCKGIAAFLTRAADPVMGAALVEAKVTQSTLACAALKLVKLQVTHMGFPCDELIAATAHLFEVNTSMDRYTASTAVEELCAIYERCSVIQDPEVAEGLQRNLTKLTAGVQQEGKELSRDQSEWETGLKKYRGPLAQLPPEWERISRGALPTE